MKWRPRVSRHVEEQSNLSVSRFRSLAIRLHISAIVTGHTEFQEGWWVGIQCDEPIGKNDGRYSEYIYFSSQVSNESTQC